MRDHKWVFFGAKFITNNQSYLAAKEEGLNEECGYEDCLVMFKNLSSVSLILKDLNTAILRP